MKIAGKLFAKLDETLSPPSAVRREMCTAIHETDVRNIKPGQVLPPVWLSFDRIEAFCAIPPPSSPPPPSAPARTPLCIQTPVT